MMRNTECTTQVALEEIPPPVPDFLPGHITKVLLIEDDRLTRRIVSAELDQYCDLIEAPDINQGINAYNVFQPDIVFMDIELPDGNGQNLLDWIIRKDPDAFVVMFSGHSDVENVTRAVRGGAKGFIMKPFDTSKMLHFIRLCQNFH